MNKKVLQDIHQIVNEGTKPLTKDKYKDMSLQQLERKKAELEKAIENSERGGIEYETLESQIDLLDDLIKKAKE